MNAFNSSVPALSGDSPFDALRRMDERGEYWSGRDLQITSGYSRWENFAVVIEKARASLALVQGDEAAQNHFLDMQEMVSVGSGAQRSVSGVRLTRFGAYLVAMAGDDTKPEVAHARVYFAVKTREAEVAPAPKTRLELAREQVRMIEALEAAESKVKELAPQASKWDRFMKADGLIDMTAMASLLNLPVSEMTNRLVDRRIFCKQVSVHSHRRPGVRNMPRREYMKGNDPWFTVKTETNAHGISYPVAYATARGADLIVSLLG